MSGKKLRDAKRNFCKPQTICLPGQKPFTFNFSAEEIFNPFPISKVFSVEGNEKVSDRVVGLLSLLLDTLEANEFAHSVTAERKAQRLLRHHVSRKQYQAYIISGMFYETSSSGKFYLFRRGFPTILCNIIDEKIPKKITPVAALCGHAVLYTNGTFAGGLCPTDDIIHHVLLMRADEEAFLKACNWHDFEKPMSGL
jgi:hypothetical protein